jgi:hypothetical protein
MKPTVQKIAACYGLSVSTIHAWRKRGITIHDFLDPATVFRKLSETLTNVSPRWLALREKQTQLEIIFRLAVAGLIEPNQ